jgi:hypothetical protein
MFQIIYECVESWPNNRPLRVETPQFSFEISVAPDVARRRANGYLGMNVAMSILAGEPSLILGDPPVWRMSANLHLPDFGFVATVGSIEVDALTGKVLPLSFEQITTIQDRADVIATRLAPTAEPVF